MVDARETDTACAGNASCTKRRPEITNEPCTCDGAVAKEEIMSKIPNAMDAAIHRWREIQQEMLANIRQAEIMGADDARNGREPLWYRVGPSYVCAATGHASNDLVGAAYIRGYTAERLNPFCLLWGQRAQGARRSEEEAGRPRGGTMMRMEYRVSCRTASHGGMTYTRIRDARRALRRSRMVYTDLGADAQMLWLECRPLYTSTWEPVEDR
jgi:hypothetical protein